MMSLKGPSKKRRADLQTVITFDAEILEDLLDKRAPLADINAQFELFKSSVFKLAHLDESLLDDVSNDRRFSSSDILSAFKTLDQSYFMTYSRLRNRVKQAKREILSDLINGVCELQPNPYSGSKLRKAPIVEPKKITAPESTQTHEIHMEKAHAVLTRCTESGPVPFFRFVINPRSFVQTVYNIFITSFLVHEQHAVLSIGDNHELFIQHAPGSTDALSDAGNIQLVTSINALEWQALVKNLKIQSAMLPDFCPQVSKYFIDNQLGDDLGSGVAFLDP